MEELFMVDQNTLIALVALVVFVIFVVIYKSKQNPTYYSGDNKYSSEDVEEVRDYQDEKHRQNSKSNKKKNKKRNKNSDEEKNIDFATIWAFCMIGLYFFNRTDFVFVFKWSFVLAGVVYMLIKLFVPVEIIKAFTSKDD